MATIEELIRKLRIGDPIERQHAAQELGKLGDPRAIEPLVEAMLHDRDKTVCSTAAVWLGKMGKPEAIPGLARAVLSGGAPEIRAHAADALGLIRHSDAIPVLIEASFDSHPSVRLAAVWSLAQFRDPKVIPPLLDRLGNDYDEIEQHALNGIRKHMLIHPDAILKLPPEARNRLGRILQDKYREQLSKELCKKPRRKR
jgi:HEAT repeat protein